MARPYVTVNVAMSADGKISTRERRQVKISGPEDFTRVDRLRAGSDAIMVGIGTVLADDPSLTVKSPSLQNWRKGLGLDPHPVRVVVDSLARTPPGAAVLHRGAGVRIIACSRKADPRNREALAGLARVVVAGEEQVDLEALLGDLSGMGIRRLIVEGGGTLIWALISLGLVDEFCSFVGNLVIGGGEAPTPVDGTGFTVSEGFPRLTLVSADRVDQGILLRWKPERA